jgi:hypothetical protein
LDHKLSRYGNRFKGAFHGCRTARKGCSDTEEGFLFGGLSPPNKKTLLCVLSVLWYTRINLADLYD